MTVAADPAMVLDTEKTVTRRAGFRVGVAVEAAAMLAFAAVARGSE